jgi:vanillate O-demethylase ferredoxin subunit
MTETTMKLRVSAVRDEAQDTRSYEFVDPEGGALPAFTAGSHLDVHLPGGLLRQFSLANDPLERHRYLVAVLCERDGRGGSSDMHDNVRVGDLVEIGGPRNHFPLSDLAEHHLLIAGGIGITPMMAMLRHLNTSGAAYSLHYCTRSEEKTAFMGELQAAPFAGKVQFHHDQGDPSKGLDVAALLGPVQAGTHVYCCGPAGLMGAVRAAAEHWPSGTVHFEYFSVDPDALEPHGLDTAFEVEIESTGEVYKVSAEETIMEVLRANGHDVPSACEEGICGTCLTEVVSGEIEHRDLVLDDEEKAANDIMTVCCSRAKSPRLKLRL